MLNEEVTIKLLGKISLQYPEINQLELRDIIDLVLNDYEVHSKETALVKSDMPERAAMYLAVKKLDGLSLKTLYNYRLHLERFHCYMPKPLNFITTTDIRMYLATISKDIKNTTLCTVISVLKSFFGWLQTEEIIEKNPMLKIKEPKTEKRLRKALNTEEIEILRDHCLTLREKAILDFLFATGTRLSELVNTNIEDINWNDLSLKVIGKGDKERKVYFNVRAKLALKNYLNSRNDNCEALFVTTRRPVGRLGNRSIQREIEKIAKRAGFNKSVFPHLLRHSNASYLVNKGANLSTVQKLLGHSSMDTTLVYARLNDQSIQEEYRKHLG